ncbi:Omp28-related outer membrane protein [Myroides indicus]|uniref:Outer membrane protein Omp28 n=1 Tax=Myroides indicus TaxID=1323422 RepID=A0A4V3E7J3_9FLAO|nr:Omp28-related outer membrane protein [Myroides indicus]TDS51081.1 outer membrane protein Omp28 [Myroides indicus]
MKKRFYFGAVVLLSLLFSTSLFISCSSSDDDTSPSNTLSLIANKTTILINEEVSFTVKGDDKNIEDASLYINNQIVEGLKHSFETTGEYKVVAKKEGYADSNIITIQVNEEHGTEGENNEVDEDYVPTGDEAYVHKVVVEDFTGTWCVWCPRVAYSIEKAVEEFGKKIVPIAIHRGNIDPSAWNYDPFNFNGSGSLENKLGVTGYPAVFINRIKSWKYPEDKNTSDPGKYLNNKTSIGIKISSELSQNSGTVSLDIAFSETFNEELKYIIYILEDNLIYDQDNATEHYGGADVIKDFVFNDVVRTSTDILGSPLSNTTKGNIFKLENTKFNYESKNAANLKIAVLIVNKDGYVLNAQVAKANTVKNYVIAK